jgi:Ribonuclease G/E
MSELYYSATGGGLANAGWAALVGDDSLLGFSMDAAPGTVRAGEVHIARLRVVDRARGLGFVELANGREAVIDLPRSGRQFVEGARLLVQIQRPAHRDKLAKTTSRVMLEGVRTAVMIMPSGTGFVIETKLPEKPESNATVEATALASIAEALVAAATRPNGLHLVRPGRNAVADLLFRFPDAVPAAVRCDTRLAADAIRRSLADDPVGRGITVDHMAARDWRYRPAELQGLLDDVLEERQPLHSGGSLLIEPCETLTAIDVNAGAAAASSGAERVAADVNREAVSEIARLIRCRNVAGNIVIDFIGMRARGKQRDLVERLRLAFSSDPARPWIGAMSPIGLVEMSRRFLGAGPLGWQGAIGLKRLKGT